MAEPTYVVQKPSGYYFRFRVPEDIKPIVKQTEFRYSLRTRRTSIAKSKARLIAGNIQLLIRTLRSNSSMTSRLTSDRIPDLIRGYLSQALEADEESRILYTMEPEAQQEQLMGYDEVEDMTKMSLSLSQHQEIEQLVDNLILKPNDISAPKDSFEYKKLFRETLKAQLQLISIQRKRETGDYSDELPDLMTIQPVGTAQTIDAAAVQPSYSEKTISEIMSMYFEENKGQWTPKTFQEIQASLDVFLRYFGDIPINTITRTKMTEFKQAVMKLPPNINKLSEYRGKTIHEIIRMKPSQTISVHIPLQIKGFPDCQDCIIMLRSGAMATRGLLNVIMLRTFLVQSDFMRYAQKGFN